VWVSVRTMAQNYIKKALPKIGRAFL